MAGRKKQQPERTQSSSAEASARIEGEIEAFLKSGGKIQQIRRGVSGQESMAGRKHITIGQGKEAK